MTNTPKDKTPSEFKRFDFKREINAKTGIEKSWAEECSNGRYILFFDHEAAIAAERQKATTLEAKVEECRNVIVMQQDAIKIASDRIKALEGAIEEFLSYSYKSFPSHSEAIEEGLRIRELCQDLLNRKEALGSPLHQDGKVTPEFKAEVDKVIKHCDHILSRSGMDDEAPGDSAGPEKEALIEHFNTFIKKWCGKSYPHLIDSDENDGERFREAIREAIDRARGEGKSDGH